MSDMLKIVAKCNVCKKELKVIHVNASNDAVRVRVEQCLDCSYDDYKNGFVDGFGNMGQRSKEQFEHKKTTEVLS